MLEVRPNCEHCGKELPNTSSDAMICSFECTYCTHCALELFQNVCPSCGGNFQPRPVRPKAMIRKYQASEKIVLDRKTKNQITKMINKYGKLKPEER